ncbi:hypothetical protein SA496_24830 [Pseudomonas sp. JS3066]|uniref:hypothetical protein n=1 Tax=Pseudomonas sp. JS3066 TaxID=3090665 RepID=UPI002E7B6B2E|nr:hypothetical protein [Pseudomonas sp. JS3066]WVK92898.1 hypothetical protein SA496_24830 [Pseudomonas sp. JS3066]
MSSTQHLRPLLAAGFLLLLAACANIGAQTTEYVGTPHAAPTDPAGVEVLRREPARPHDRLGEVVVDASTEPPPPVTEIEQKLREEAAEIGGEAVVVVYDRIQPVAAYVSGPLWARDVETIQGRKLKGIVIRYR